eukprot:TRINITY_DN2156_c0_g1_i8.p1 TRINITY_DN2156_c0_g1~~TRINITY_DN2156_c0_g1_i8.p1  ORF type:complete len:558 (+),score=185.96 TRINITY_DN2156_c0_g1_i8:128-1801(+)
MMVNELESRFADFDMIPGRADMTNALRNTEYDVDSAFQLILEQQKPKKPLVLDTTPKKPKKAIEIGTPSPSSGSKNSTSSSNNKGKTTAGSTNDKKGKGTPSSSSSKPRIQQAAKRSKAVQKAIAEYAEDKARVNMVVVGHVDAGKSTMMGHLLYQIGSVAKQDLRKFEKESKQIGKGSFHFAWVMDNEDEERERGVTIDVGVRSFETDSKEITLLDAPGHRDFIPNMINGASQADVAILVVNAAEGEFESGFHDGGQTKEHAMLVRSLGVSDLVVAVNKMDIVDWSQERYLSIVAEVSEFLKSSGFKDEVDFVPVSGFTGENLVANTADALKEWYDGPTLLERIDKFSPPLRPLDIPLRMPISDLYKGSGNTVVVIGRVESGIIAPGDRVLVAPRTEIATVKSVIGTTDALSFGLAGANVEVVLQDIEYNVLTAGNVLCDPQYPCPVGRKLRAQILTMGTPVRLGHSCLVHLHSVKIPAVVTKLIKTIDKRSGETLQENPRFLGSNQAAIVEVLLEKPVCMEQYKRFKQMGRFMLRDGNQTIAAGVIIKIKKIKTE